MIHKWAAEEQSLSDVSVHAAHTHFLLYGRVLDDSSSFTCSQGPATKDCDQAIVTLKIVTASTLCLLEKLDAAQRPPM